MSIPYRMVIRPDMKPGASKDSKLFYPQTRSLRKIGYARLCSKIAAVSTASAGDVSITISGLIFVLKDHLADGDVVQVGDLGSFRLVAGAPGVKNLDDFHTGLFRRPRIVFTPGTVFNQLLTEITYEKLSPIPEEPADLPPEGGGGGEGGDDVL